MLKRMTMLACASVLAFPAFAVEITAPTQKMLDELKLGPEVLEGLDAELAVPQEWIDKAKLEDPVEIRMTVNEKLFTEVWEVFSARYPWMKPSYFHASGAQRTTQPLMAVKRGDYIVDVIASYNSAHADFVEANLLTDLSVLPTFDSTGAANSRDNFAIGVGMSRYCLGYNTNNVKKEELPKTWDELVDNPRWHNGKIGMGRNYTPWVPQLIALKGKEWGDQFIKKLFEVAKPQFRKENLQMIPKLASLGEFDISIPSADAHIAVNAEQGVPIGYHCPEPIPLNFTWVAVIKDSPRWHSAMIFANWLASKEGQMTIFWKDKEAPSHKDLGVLLIYPDEVAGKETAPTTVESLKIMADMAEDWAARWLAAGGPPPPQ